MPNFREQNGEIFVGGLTIQPLTVNVVANVNNLSINASDGSGQQSMVKLVNSTGGSLNITGIVAPDDEGQFVFMQSSLTSDAAIVLKHLDGASDAANQFNFASGADVTIPRGGRCPVVYLDGKWCGN